MSDPIEIHDEVANPLTDLVEMAHEGIEQCRAGRWSSGIELLRHTVDQASDHEYFPALAFSYLGYGLARFDKQYKFGLELCKRGVAVDSFEAEAYLSLAKTYMLLDSRKSAIETLDRGLRIDPHYEELVKMRNTFGRRRPTLVSSLSRNHFVNRIYGELFSRLTRTAGSSPGLRP